MIDQFYEVYATLSMIHEMMQKHYLSMVYPISSKKMLKTKIPTNRLVGIHNKIKRMRIKDT